MTTLSFRQDELYRIVYALLTTNSSSGSVVLDYAFISRKIIKEIQDPVSKKTLKALFNLYINNKDLNIPKYKIGVVKK